MIYIHNTDISYTYNYMNLVEINDIINANYGLSIHISIIIYETKYLYYGTTKSSMISYENYIKYQITKLITF